MPVTIIAEIGVNHDGCIGQAKRLIDEAKTCGADVVKFQTFSAERLASAETPKVDYQHSGTSHSESHLEMLRKLELPEDAFSELMAYCDSVGIGFTSTPYSAQDAQLLLDIGIDFIKTASADIVDRELHELLAKSGKPVIIATGMATLEEIDATLEIYSNGDAQPVDITILHCTSAYPADPADAHLNAIPLLAKRYASCQIGYSDHTPNEYCAVAAVALGATIIEKHFTTDKALPGPDHAASADPSEFTRLVKAIRQTEIALGESKKQVAPSEQSMRAVSRKSLHALSDLPAGTEIARQHLQLKRPNNGISPMDLQKLIGRKLKVKVSANQPLTWDSIEGERR